MQSRTMIWDSLKGLERSLWVDIKNVFSSEAQKKAPKCSAIETSPADVMNPWHPLSMVKPHE